jgi:hypothetical protein
MSLRPCRVKTGLITSVPLTRDDEQRAPAVSLAGPYTNGAIVLNAQHVVLLDTSVTRTFDADTHATLGDSTTAIDLDGRCYVTYVDDAGAFKCCRQEHLATIAASADVWPMHYIHAPEITRYQLRTRPAIVRIVVVIAHTRPVVVT